MKVLILLLNNISASYLEGRILAIYQDVFVSNFVSSFDVRNGWVSIWKPALLTLQEQNMVVVPQKQNEKNPSLKILDLLSP